MKIILKFALRHPISFLGGVARVPARLYKMRNEPTPQMTDEQRKDEIQHMLNELKRMT